ncbi:MAG: glycine cleavage system aminomethyltransferase GcvT [Tepidisphaeraceae bacterium]
MLKRTPFYDFHVKAGGRMVDFAGWELPVQYKSIVDEHNQTRRSGGLFDVSHMGRVHLKGKDVVPFLDYACTRNFSKTEQGQCRYSLVCNEAGGVLDDVIIGRDAKHWIMVCNASNRAKILDHFKKVRSSKDFDLDITDQTESTAMVALQGPKIIEKIAGTLGDEVSQLKRYHFFSGSMFLIGYTVFRTGYTGEDGVELVFSARMAPMIIGKLAGRFDREEATIKPAGLGARDTLRLEAGMPLYGHELTETTDPISAGLEWAVDLGKDFIGATALRKVKDEGPKQKLVGLVLDSKRIARQGTPVLNAHGSAVGLVTSGTFGPTVQKSIAMAYVNAEDSAIDTKLAVDIKGEQIPATVVKLPFYARPK